MKVIRRELLILYFHWKVIRKYYEQMNKVTILLFVVRKRLERTVLAKTPNVLEGG